MGWGNVLSPRHLSLNRNQLRVLGRSLRRQCPFLAKPFVELAAEERCLHAAIDDAPRQHAVISAIAEHEEVRIYSGVGNSAPPIAAVGLGGLNRRRHTAIAEREQSLVKRMTLRLDIEKDVVDIRRQLT